VTVGRIITTPACVAEGMAWLVAAEPRFGRVVEAVPVLPLRRQADGFATMLDIITGQQVSTAAAAAIWARMEAAGMTTPEGIRAASDDALRAAGVSRQKARYARALAEAGVDFAALRDLPDDKVIRRLTSLPGVGPWTAEIYAMFALGRADAFAPGDLALQEAARDLFALDARPSDKVLRAMSVAWSPWRSVAARALWAWYRVVKAREGVR
jgi:DNA-3-methyladenine glycosylase II